MFIGHLPAGYLLTRRLHRAFGLKGHAWIGWAGSLFPDLDLIHFYLIDGRQHLHHSYWTHTPFFWFLVAAGAMMLALVRRSRQIAQLCALFLSNVFLHLCLDTISGGIRWLYPLSNAYIRLTTVPAKYEWWMANYILHWTFLPEVFVTMWAATVFLAVRPRQDR